MLKNSIRFIALSILLLSFWESSALSVFASTYTDDVTAPDAPQVNELTDQDTVVTGTAEPNSVINVKYGTLILGTGTTNEDGTFTVSIPKQSQRGRVEVTATDAAGNESEATVVYIVDVTAPLAPYVNVVTDNSTMLTGSAEAYSTITVKNGLTVIGTGTASTKWSFYVYIPKQIAGTKLQVTATDRVGHTSEATEVTVTSSTQ
ncbi:Ig-like domain-containing protein [Niallia sp. 01092]|uniref:Ig-like domain-containing protein n=1 Tax=unclassified Niallia TaxID=2837522 RepID=UPI003FD16052